MTATPASLGYAMPAEWAPHRATWLAWPHNPKDWPGKFPAIPWAYAEIVRHLSRHEKVEVLVEGADHERTVRRMIDKAGADLKHIHFHRVRTDRSWTRDSGPIFVRNRKGLIAATVWHFNAWAKYPNWKRDVKVAGAISRTRKSATFEPAHAGRPVVLEGGAIDVDGEGTLLATEECLLSKVQARNPGMSRTEIEKVLSEYLGTPKVLWLKRGIVGDDTHGHIDDVARFVAPGKVMLCEESDRKDENHSVLQENRKILTSARDASGRRLEVIPLPMPSPLYFEGVRVPASYANFYIANGLVLVPTFNDARDRVALGLIAEHFPGREVVGIHAVDLVWGFGTIHCLTQQEPE